MTEVPSIETIMEIIAFIFSIGIGWGSLKVKIEKIESNTNKSLDYLEEAVNKINIRLDKEIDKFENNIKENHADFSTILKEFKLDVNLTIDTIKNDLEKKDIKREQLHENDLLKTNNIVKDLTKEYKQNVKIISARILNGFNKFKELKEGHANMLFSIKGLEEYEIPYLKKDITNIKNKLDT